MKQLFQHFFKTWLHHGALQFTTLVVLASSFALITSITSLSFNLDRILTLWGETMQMAVYLNDDVSDGQIKLIEEGLKQKTEIGSLQFVNKEKAVEEFNTQMKSYAPGLAKEKELLKFIPSSFQVSLASSIPVSEHLATLKELATSIGAMPGVEEVSFGQEWVKNFTSVITAIHNLGLIFIVVFLFASAFVISTSIKTSIEQRRSEIEVLELIGATKWYIRLPFVVEGAILGTMAAALGLLVSYLAFTFFADYVGLHLSFLELAEHLQFLNWAQGVAILIAGLIGGLLASWLCVRSLNSGWLAAKGSES